VNRGLDERQLRDLFYEHYALGNEIGKGGFGTIFGGIRRSDGMPVAIKVIKKSKITQWYEFGNTVIDESGAAGHETSNDGPIVTRRIPLEIALMIRVSSCKHCIQILDYLEQKSCFIIIMERLESSKDLFDLITEFSVSSNSMAPSSSGIMSQHSTFYGLEENLAKGYFRQIVEAAVDILKLGVLHRDIKDENILIDLTTNQIKLIDFGAGTFVNETVNFSDFHGNY
jgi:serine/threonine protein kinase